MRNYPFPFKLCAIAALDENGVIGIHNQLPWHLPNDLKHFRALTLGHPIIMGRATYESIGKALPGRINIVLTRNPKWQAPDCLTVYSWDEAQRIACEVAQGEIFVIGGSKIYEQSLSLIERLYLTEVHHCFEGDAYFPPLNKKEWIEVARENFPQDDSHAYSYSFVILDRAI